MFGSIGIVVITIVAIAIVAIAIVAIAIVAIGIVVLGVGKSRSVWYTTRLGGNVLKEYFSVLYFERNLALSIHEGVESRI